MTENSRRAVGGNSDHLLGTGQRACKTPVGMSNMGTHPTISPTDEIGCEHSQHGLDLDASSTAAHQMLDFEGGFLFFVPGLNRLPRIVMGKPGLQVWQWGRCRRLRADQDREQVAFGCVEPLQANSHRIGASVEVVIWPGDQLGILTHTCPRAHQLRSLRHAGAKPGRACRYPIWSPLHSRVQSVR